MAEETGNPGGYAREVRDTIIKSSLTGVAATVLAVTIFSPAGLGGMIGTSVASGLGLDTHGASSSDDAYANLPAFPSPLSQGELTQIRGELAQTTASLEITRAATEAKIEYIRSIAASRDIVAYTRAPEPAVVVPVIAVPAAPAPVEAANAGGGADLTIPHRDPNMELAALLFAHENY